MTAQKELILYETKDGKSPFEKWLHNLKDKKGRAIIRTRLDRLEQGNIGKCESVGKGVFEVKIYFGPGYRIYFGEDGETIIILLCGGNKSTQNKDIRKSQEYWTDYLRRKHEKISR